MPGPNDMHFDDKGRLMPGLGVDDPRNGTATFREAPRDGRSRAAREAKKFAEERAALEAERAAFEKEKKKAAMAAGG